ncbi:MAG: serine/threonine-protein kinase [Victivallales bacterium]
MLQQLIPGYKLNGRFEILKLQGKGSLGDTVYIGRHPDLEKEVIIRVLPPEMAAGTDTVQRFIQAVKLTAALKHQNILPAYDAGDENGLLFFVSASETGLYLSDYVKMKAKLEQDEAVKIIMAIADALEYAWNEKKILHRNVCPSTILIAAGVHPMLTDFGLAKSFEPGKDDLTVMGYTIGNPQYMSPEQARGERELSYQADMYCLGLVFYEMLAGAPAFQCKTHFEMMEAQMEKSPKPLSNYNSNVNADCLLVMNKMIEKDRNKRYETWAGLIKDLKALLAGKPIAASAVKKKLVSGRDPVSRTGGGKAYNAYGSRRVKESNLFMGVIITIIVVLAIIAAGFIFLKYFNK